MQHAECDAATDGWMAACLVAGASLSYKLCARLVVCYGAAVVKGAERHAASSKCQYRNSTYPPLYLLITRTRARKPHFFLSENAARTAQAQFILWG
jgi:hypothetical protein